MRRALLASLTLALAGASLGAQAGEWDFGGDVAGELRVFPEGPRYPGQLDTLQPSLTLRGDARYRSEDRRHQVVFVPYARVDFVDDERSHFDVREGYYRYAGDEFEVLAGSARIFWGTTESRHLVDIINQTDAVEDIDEEDKLGQPMIKLSLLKDWGKIDFFALPIFRERTFPGEDGRLRFDPPIDTDNPRFRDGGEDLTSDFAVRYSHFFGNVDLGVSYFRGISREPGFEFTPVGQIRPVYERINQLGVDAQYTTGAWLWKFEGILREGQGDTFAAAVAGFEYTFFGVTDSGADLGVLLEYLHDGRDEFRAPVTTLENDVFYGARLALNDIQDTSILAGAITDLEDGSTAGLIEAERRLGQNWKGELEARFFTNVDDGNILQPFSDDSVLTLRLTRYF